MTGGLGARVLAAVMLLLLPCTSDGARRSDDALAALRSLQRTLSDADSAEAGRVLELDFRMVWNEAGTSPELLSRAEFLTRVSAGAWGGPFSLSEAAQHLPGERTVVTTAVLADGAERSGAPLPRRSALVDFWRLSGDHWKLALRVSSVLGVRRDF